MELVRFPSRGGFSVRSVFTFVLAVVVTALLWAIFSGTPAHAANDAHWGGDSIIYNNRGFTEDSTFKDTTGTIPSDATIYRTTVQDPGNTSNQRKVLIIYFSSGVDPPTATQANYIEFDFDGTDTSNPQNQRTISLELKSDQNGYSSCAVTGVGWYICPISVFLAEGMDKIFDILSGMIATQPPVLGDATNSMYIAWNIMRSIANVAFVIAFLIIIYSQLTGLGVSNYGLKRLTPRLIVAAILVNISFYISALAIDVSNILGYAAQDIFNSIRESTFHLTSEEVNIDNPWAKVTEIALGAGGLIGGVWYLSTGGIHFLLPLLVGLLLTVILVVVVLAARQAIIIILVIVSPLAFVANLLPNTEKWFSKWKDLFMTMLIFFPAFSLVFGGSQLAGQIIMQNANGDIVMLIFGLAVQIAPLVITPLILKLSGGLLGKIAQITNNPKKGLIDRSRNYAERRAEHTRQQNIARGPRWYNPASYGAGMVRGADYRKRRLNDKTELWKQAATNRYEETSKYGAIHQRKAAVDDEQKAIHNEHEAHLERERATPGTALHTTGRRVQVSKDQLETQQQRLAAHYNEQRVTSGSALNISNNELETAKGYAEASEQDKNAYLNRQRTYRTTMLGAAAERLESSKINAEGWQSAYTAHIDDLKLSPTSNLGDVTRFAESNKTHAEAAQSRVQAMLDRDRRTVGTDLNLSTVNLEGAKLEAEASKSLTARYISDVKADAGTTLHVEHVRAEQAKLSAQRGESKLNLITEEYKSGEIERTGELESLMNLMVEDTKVIAAQNRGAQAAQNIQQKNFAIASNEDSPMGHMLIETAASVDPQGAIRARAAATSQLAKIEKEALENNVILIKSAAEDKGVSDIEWARGLTQKHRGVYKDETTGAILAAEPQDDGLLEAAYELLASDGDIGSIRDAMVDTGFDDPESKYKSMMGRVIARNAPTLKVKGGFDLQQKIGKLWNASREEMDISIAGSLGAISAENIPGQKWGWWNSLAKGFDEQNPDAPNVPLKRIIDTVDAMPAGSDKTFAESMLKSIYANITTALSSPEIMTKMGDRKGDTSDMHKILHRRFTDSRLEVDYNLTENGIADTRPRR